MDSGQFDCFMYSDGRKLTHSQISLYAVHRVVWDLFHFCYHSRSLPSILSCLNRIGSSYVEHCLQDLDYEIHKSRTLLANLCACRSLAEIDWMDLLTWVYARYLHQLNRMECYQWRYSFLEQEAFLFPAPFLCLLLLMAADSSLQHFTVSFARAPSLLVNVRTAGSGDWI